MNTSNAAADKAGKVPEKISEKILEKRRALGRGLESLLPGPRVVPAPAASSQSSVPGSQETHPAAASTSTVEAGWPAAVASPATPGTLEQLQAAAPETAPTGEHAFEIALDLIEQNPHQTRLEFDPRALNDLAASIQTQGVLQPIVVRPSLRPAPIGPGSELRYVLILGERRFRASKMAGKTTIPAIVKRVSEQQAAEMTLVENLQRQDLDCLEQANAFANLSKEFKLTQEQIGNRVGVSREQVSNYLRLLSLPPTVIESLRKKELTYSHARLLLSLREDAEIAKVAHVVVAKKMSVALLEEMILNIDLPRAEGDERKAGGARWVDPNVKAAQRSLEAVLGVRVRIRDRKGKGKITIEYGTLEDFDRVVGMLKGKSEG
jgi:ParB family chromosome partitioning protein